MEAIRLKFRDFAYSVGLTVGLTVLAIPLALAVSWKLFGPGKKK